MELNICIFLPTMDSTYTPYISVATLILFLCIDCNVHSKIPCMSYLQLLRCFWLQGHDGRKLSLRGTPFPMLLADRIGEGGKESLEGASRQDYKKWTTGKGSSPTMSLTNHEATIALK